MSTTNISLDMISTPAKPALLSLTPEGLKAWIAEKQQPAYRLVQIKQWLLLKRCMSFSDMSDLPKSLRDDLANTFALYSEEIEIHKIAEGGPSKLGFLPRIDWLNAVEQRTLIGCADERTANWIKSLVKTFGDGFGAYMKQEGPNLEVYSIFVRYPTAKREPQVILKGIKVNNGLEGTMTLMKSNANPAGVNMIIGADLVMEESLKRVNYKTYFGIACIIVFTKMDKDVTKKDQVRADIHPLIANSHKLNYESL